MEQWKKLKSYDNCINNSVRNCNNCNRITYMDHKDIKRKLVLMKTINYSKEFLRDVEWYKLVAHKFNFDGADGYFKKVVKITQRRNSDNEVVSVREMSFNAFQAAFDHLESNISKGLFYTYQFQPIAYPLIIFDLDGVDAIRAFYEWDSNGEVYPTFEPENFQKLLKTKGSVNLHIKMYAEDRANGCLPRLEFQKICKEFNTPTWFIDAVENQKSNYYENMEMDRR